MTFLDLTLIYSLKLKQKRIYFQSVSRDLKHTLLFLLKKIKKKEKEIVVDEWSNPLTPTLRPRHLTEKRRSHVLFAFMGGFALHRSISFQVLAMNTPNHFKSKREHNLWHCFLGTLYPFLLFMSKLYGSVTFAIRKWW